jgi:hypothetical protein
VVGAVEVEQVGEGLGLQQGTGGQGHAGKQNHKAKSFTVSHL